MSEGMVSGISINNEGEETKISFVIEVHPEMGKKAEALCATAKQAVENMPGVSSVSVVLTAHKRSKEKTERKNALPGVKKVIAIASGKGGVGKSTTAVNIAVAMAISGLKVGLLDADVYGPSIPRLLGIKDEKPDVDESRGIQPIQRYGISCMSIGFLVPEDKPMIWRGPMVHSALQQLLNDVDWGELDVLIVDMPPGTGDAQLTITQQVPLAGAVIVSTPQDIALIDARKGMETFKRMNVPVIGIVENMSYFLCPHCGERSEIFAHGGAKQEAEKLGIDFLGAIPLDIAVRETSDRGEPIAASESSNKQVIVYRNIASKIFDITST